jgi:hypothetical protein
MFQSPLALDGLGLVNGTAPAAFQAPRFARRRPPPVISGTAAARESMGRDHNPVPGQWYESLDDEEVFQVLSVDEDAELIELQYEDGDVEEIDYETWQELDLDLTGQPEGWSGSEGEDDDEDEDDFDEDEDEEDDDWDDDEDEDEDDYGDRDDY